jgi:hypothetical protein
MATIRTHIVMPQELAQDIDKLAGPRGRSAFLVALAEREVKKQKMLAFLNRDEPAWLEQNHPDIAAVGTAAWVHNLRHEMSPRQKQIEELAREGESR